MKMRVFLFLAVLTVGHLQSQSMDSLSVVSTPKIDSIQRNSLSVQQIEKQWLSELYNNTLYDTLTSAVSNQSYEAIYFPELPTDTLKKRLAILNAKTPFNIEYNPSLESVIKSYLVTM